jgi:hypothetical protein
MPKLKGQGLFLQDEAFSAINKKLYGPKTDDRTPLASNPQNDPLRDAYDDAQGVLRAGGGNQEGQGGNAGQGRNYATPAD